MPGRTVLTLALLLAATPALAHEHVYADAFGNLVIEAASGYKRIIVGEGARARELEEAIGAREPRVVYDGHHPVCLGTVVYRGRAYMYGVDRGSTVVLPGPACN